MEHTVEAFNTASSSTNKIHDDEVARSYGFGGGLVPGVDVFAYLTHLPAATWGAEWLAAGSISARFLSPVYDGETVTVSGDLSDGDARMALALRGPDGEVRATGDARCRAAPDPGAEPAVPERQPLPDERPPASAESLAIGTTLGSVTQTFDAGAAGEYLADVRETLPLYGAERIAHPGWLLRFANTVLAANVVLGPWIHVSSDVRFIGLVVDGDALDVRAVVLDERERSGHRFVTLDVAMLGVDDGALRQRVTHTAIHTPRRATGLA